MKQYKHGETLYRAQWYFIPNYKGNKLFAFKFRFDPVPFVHKRVHRGFGNYYKIPKVMNEKRQWYDDGKRYGRLKRSPRNLPNPWDDYQRGDIDTRYSWKKRNKCRKQWQKKLKNGFSKYTFIQLEIELAEGSNPLF